MFNLQPKLSFQVAMKVAAALDLLVRFLFSLLDIFL